MIRLIKEASLMPIERAQMRIQVTANKEGRKLKEKLVKVVSCVESEEWDGSSLILVTFFSSLATILIEYSIMCWEV